MYNVKYIIPGLIIFVGIITMPIWLNLFSPKYTYPEVSLPGGPGMEECVEPAEWMRANHMSLLIDWRDKALREEKRVYVSSVGKNWEISLQNTCMKCHANKTDFCDKCHDTNSVAPYCWDCHIIPQGNNNEF